MGGVRRVLPRLLILAAPAAGLVLMVASRDAGADVPDPGLEPLGSEVGSRLVPQSAPAALPLLDSSPPQGSPAPAPAPLLADPVAALAAPVQTVTAPAGNLAPAVETATAEPAAAPHHTIKGATSALPLGGGNTTPSSASAGTLAAPSAAASEPGPLLDSVAAALVPEPLDVTLPGVSSVLSPPALGGAKLPAVPALAPLPSLPTLPAALTGSGSDPSPSRPALPTAPPGALPGPAPTSGLIESSSHSAASSSYHPVVPSTDPATGLPWIPGEPLSSEPATGSGPARAPPDGAPQDPPHRGSAHDNVSQNYPALPGTDQLGGSRRECWRPGTEVELSATQKEPSVSPD